MENNRLGHLKESLDVFKKNDKNVIIIVPQQFKRTEHHSAVGNPWSLPPVRQSSRPALCDPTCCYCPVLVIPHIPEPRRGIPGPLTQIVLLHWGCHRNQVTGEDKNNFVQWDKWSHIKAFERQLSLHRSCENNGLNNILIRLSVVAGGVLATSLQLAVFFSK